ncbi:MAG TPA: hypothetical protein VGP50_02045 [Stellaceae bacterium]|nr:hypothetical protein [Stellaceae bacterium]
MAILLRRSRVGVLFFSKACAVPTARLDRKPLIRNTFLPIIAIGGGFCYDEKRHYMA